MSSVKRSHSNTNSSLLIMYLLSFGEIVTREKPVEKFQLLHTVSDKERKSNA